MTEKKEEKVKTDKELLLEEIRGLITDSTKDGVLKADLDERIEKINTTISEKLDNDDMKKLKEGVDKLMKATTDNAAAIKAMTEDPAKKANEKPMTFKEALIAAVEEKAKTVPGLLADIKDDNGERKSLSDYFNKLGNKSTPVMTINKAADMLEATIVQSNVDTVRMTELDAKRVGIPLTIYPHVIDWVPSKTISRKYMSLLVVYSYSDGADTKTQGSAAGQSSFLLKTVEFVSATIGTYFRLSDETLDDLPEAMEEIAVVGPSKILDNIDGQILGSAGDDTSTIKGLFAASKKTDFAATWDGTIPSATIVDLIEKMKLQVEGSKYHADVVLMNATDISDLGSKKDQLDNSITDRRVVWSTIGEPIFACGLRIIKSTTMTVDTMAVLDSKQLMIGKRKDMTLEIGYDGNDFTEGQKTVVIKVRLAFGVRDALAVIYSSGVDAAVTAITNS